MQQRTRGERGEPEYLLGQKKGEDEEEIENGIAEEAHRRLLLRRSFGRPELYLLWVVALFTTYRLAIRIRAIGDPDLQSTTPGAKLKVNWKHFAIDFDDCVPVPPDAGHGCPPPRRL